MTFAPNENVSEKEKKLTDIKSRYDMIIGERQTLQKQINLYKEQSENINLWLSSAEEAKPALAAMFEDSSGPFLRGAESAITSAVQSIIGDGTSIGIEALTARNRMVARIGTVVKLSDKDGHRTLRSIFDSEGGALTNIVAFCLRAISTARSGQRRLLVIDEPDCWMSNERVRPFFKMVAEMAKMGGFQIIALTHHLEGIRDLLDESNVIKIIRDDKLDEEGNVIGKQSVRILHEDNSLPQEDNPNYISQLTLNDFNGHDESLLQFSPGMNFILGENNVGKSRILRALRCLALGLGEEADISSMKQDDGSEKFAKRAHISVDLAAYKDNKPIPMRRIKWTRKLRGSPAEKWEMIHLDENGIEGDEPLNFEGEVCSSPKGKGNEAPVWVRGKYGMNIRPLTDDTLCPQLHLQKVPSFALDKSERILGELLAIGEKAARIREMMSLLAQETLEKQREKTDLKNKIDELSLQLNKTSFISRLTPLLDSAISGKETLNLQKEALRKLLEIYKNYQEFEAIKNKNEDILNKTVIKDVSLTETHQARKLLKSYLIAKQDGEQRSNLIEKFPNLDGVDDLSERLEQQSKLIKILKSGLEEKRTFLKARRICLAFSKLDIENPSFKGTSSVRKIYKSSFQEMERYEKIKAILQVFPDIEEPEKIKLLESDIQRVWGLKKRAQDIEDFILKGQKELEELEKSERELKEDGIEVCPTCGTVCH